MSISETTQSQFDARLARKVELVNKILRRLLDDQTQIEEDLKKAISYTLEAPGKRVRSALVLWCCELVSGQVSHNAEIAAAAIEMVHTYSLVHDDLPAMDDDDLRRGRPTCHKAFDESTAILVGDALLTQKKFYMAFIQYEKSLKKNKDNIRVEYKKGPSPGGDGPFLVRPS